MSRKFRLESLDSRDAPSSLAGLAACAPVAEVRVLESAPRVEAPVSADAIAARDWLFSVGLHSGQDFAANLRDRLPVAPSEAEIADSFTAAVREASPEVVAAGEAGVVALLGAGFALTTRALFARLSDETLAVCCQKGFAPREAFETCLVERHGKRLATFFRRSLKDEAEARDLKQELCLKLWRRRLGPFNPERCFRRWLARVARNLLIDNRRRAQRERCHTNFDLAAVDPGSRPGDRLDVAAGARLRDELEAGLRRLPRDQRRVMELTLEGHRPAEIAEAMGMTEKRAYKKRDAARRGLVSLVAD